MKPQRSLIEKLEFLRRRSIIRELGQAIQFTDEPKFPQWFCIPAQGREISEEQYGGSLSLTHNIARVKALGEAVERYCSEQISEKAIEESYKNLNQNAVDPGIFINYDKTFLHGRKEEYIKRIRKKRIKWVEGVHVNTNQRILIPAQLVYSPYDFSQEPLIRTPISTGAATALTKEEAIERGIFEIIERDSFILYWLSKKQPPQINLDSQNKLKSLKDYFNRYHLDLKVYDITTDLGIPSILALVLDRTELGPSVSSGLKSGRDPLNVTIGAILEAQQVRGWIRFSYLRDQQPIINSKDQIIDLKTRGYFWYPKQREKCLEFMLNGKTKDLSGIKRFNPNLINYLIDHKMDIFCVDITTKPIKKGGIYVIKTIIPQMHPLSLDEDMPYSFSERLKAFNQGNLGQLNELPHPFL